MARLLADADALVTTGGVSMGRHDHVPAAAAQLMLRAASTTCLAMRPGKPNFAAVTPTGQPLLGLPGNPVSVLCGWVRLVRPTLQRLAGLTDSSAAPTRRSSPHPDDRTLESLVVPPGPPHH